MIINSERSRTLSLLGGVSLCSPPSDPRDIACLTHDLDIGLFGSLPLLANHLDLLIRAAITVNNFSLLLRFDLQCFLVDRILLFEPVIDKEVAAALDVERAPRQRDQVEPEQLALSQVVPDQLPLTVTEFEDARGQHLVFLNAIVELRVRETELLTRFLAVCSTCQRWVRDVLH